jgi:hypothetical protein
MGEYSMLAHLIHISPLAKFLVFDLSQKNAIGVFHANVRLPARLSLPVIRHQKVFLYDQYFLIGQPTDKCGMR